MPSAIEQRGPHDSGGFRALSHVHCSDFQPPRGGGEAGGHIHKCCEEKSLITPPRAVSELPWGQKPRFELFVKEARRQMCPNHRVAIRSLALNRELGSWAPCNGSGGWKETFKAALLIQHCEGAKMWRRRCCGNGGFLAGDFALCRYSSARRGRPKPPHHRPAVPESVH